MSRYLKLNHQFAIALVAATVLQASNGSAAEPSTRKPNIVLILADDLGWTDLACQGSKYYRTPNLDRMATEGVRFTNAYSACTVCSPTRAAVLTGQYPARLHITDWIAGHQRPFAPLSVPAWTKFLPHETTTLAELVREAGYETLHIGKWHLGPEEFGPLTHGFQTNIGGNEKGSPPSYFFPYERNAIKLPGLSEGREGEYLNDRLTDEAIRWMDAHRQSPFFVYFPHYAVHTPLQAPADLTQQNKDRLQPGNPQQNPTYAAMIENLDQNVGRLLKKLDEWKLREDTIVVFNSDNGGLTLRETTSNLPLRVGKGSAYEGGVRVPLIVRYPAQVKPAVNDTPVMSIDLLPTLVEFAAAKTKQPVTVDGRSLAGLLKDQKPIAERDLFWHYPHYHPGGATPYSAIRSGDWRLVEFFEDQRVELYNLKEDVSEKLNLAEKEPAKREELQAKLRTWRTTVSAQLPTPNPAFDKARDGDKPAPKKSAKKQAAK